MKRRLGSIFILSMVVLLGVAICFSLSGNAASQAKTKITYWVINNDPDEQLGKKYAADFMAKNPEIEVDVVRMGEVSEETIAISVAGGTAPDVCQMGPSLSVNYAKEGALIPLDSFSDFQTAAMEASKPADLLAGYKIDGHIYLMPWRGSPILLFCNKTMLDKAGVKPPKSWEDFVNVAKAVKEKTGYWGFATEGGGLQPEGWHRMFDYLELYDNTATKGHFLSDDGKRAIFAGPAGVEALKVFVDIHQAGAAPTSPVTEDLFSNGKAAMTFAGSWKFPGIEDAGVVKLDEVGVVPIPTYTGEGPSFTYGDPRDLAIFQQSKNPDAAWEFVKFIIQEQQSLDCIKITGQLPVRGDLATNPTFATYLEEHPELKPFAEAIAYTLSMDLSEHIWEVLSTFSMAFQKACLGKEDPQTALKDAASEVNKLLK